MRRAARTDSNQNAIVKSLRQIPGVIVAVTSGLGNGFPDLIVGNPNGKIGHRIAMIELKDGKKSASRKRLTSDEEKFKADWEGCYYVCESLEEVLRAIGI